MKPPPKALSASAVPSSTFTLVNDTFRLACATSPLGAPSFHVPVATTGNVQLRLFALTSLSRSAAAWPYDVGAEHRIRASAMTIAGRRRGETRPAGMFRGLSLASL